MAGEVSSRQSTRSAKARPVTKPEEWVLPTYLPTYLSPSIYLSIYLSPERHTHTDALTFLTMAGEVSSRQSTRSAKARPVTKPEEWVLPTYLPTYLSPSIYLSIYPLSDTHTHTHAPS